MYYRCGGWTFGDSCHIDSELRRTAEFDLNFITLMFISKEDNWYYTFFCPQTLYTIWTISEYSIRNPDILTPLKNIDQIIIRHKFIKFWRYGNDGKCNGRWTIEHFGNS